MGTLRSELLRAYRSRKLNEECEAVVFENIFPQPSREEILAEQRETAYYFQKREEAAQSNDEAG